MNRSMVELRGVVHALLILCVVGCAADDGRQRPPEEQGLPLPLFLDREPVLQALRALGIEREPVSVLHRPMGIDRLDVEVPSLRQEIPNLTIVFANYGRGWELEWPPSDRVEAWLESSGRE